MSSYSRRNLLLLPAALSFMACGFSPAYAPGGSGSALQNAVDVAAPTDKDAFDLVERLEERLGPPDAARYSLTYKIATDALGVGLSTENATTRYNLTGSVEWAIFDRANGAKLTSGRVSNFTSYSATGSTVAGQAAQEDAILRLMRILADQIVTQLLATSGQWAKG